MKDGLKSLLIEEHIHHVAKTYCTKKKLVMKRWFEQLILEATAPNSKPDNYTERPKGNKVSNLTSIQKKKK